MPRAFLDQARSGSLTPASFCTVGSGSAVSSASCVALSRHDPPQWRAAADIIPRYALSRQGLERRTHFSCWSSCATAQPRLNRTKRSDCAKWSSSGAEGQPIPGITSGRKWKVSLFVERHRQHRIDAGIPSRKWACAR